VPKQKKRYRLYFDESGDHTYKALEETARRYLGLTGIIVECDEYRLTFQPDLEALKQRHFPHDPDDGQVVLHRESIINKRHVFGRLRDPAIEAAFDADLLRFLQQQDYAIITVVIDKRAHVGRFGPDAFDPYHSCIDALLERYCGFLHSRGGHGDVMGESRGGREDRALKEAFNHVVGAGNQHCSRDYFADVLTSAELKLKPKPANVAGLQVADILAHPCKFALLRQEGLVEGSGSAFAERISACVAEKYNRWVLCDCTSGGGRVLL
jgi:hypothetical protein